MSNDIRAALERLVFEINESGHWLAHTDAFTAARAALAAAPEGEGPSDELNVDEVLKLAAIIRKVDGSHSLGAAALAEAILARWGRPAAPPAPLEGEVGELIAELRHFVAEYQKMRGLHPESIYSIQEGIEGREAHLRVSQLTRAAALLQQLSAAAPAVVVPIPVSERLPVAEDCDAEGRCWWGALALSGTVTGSVPHSWRLCRPEDRFGSELVWLPFNAIPPPAPQGGEVEG